MLKFENKCLRIKNTIKSTFTECDILEFKFKKACWIPVIKMVFN